MNKLQKILESYRLEKNLLPGYAELCNLAIEIEAEAFNEGAKMGLLEAELSKEKIATIIEKIKK